MRTRPRLIASLVVLAARLLVLGMWALGSVFFAIVGLRTAQALARATSPVRLEAPLMDLSGAVVTTAYSLGGAAFALGLTWLVLPSRERHAPPRLFGLWILATALLLGTRQVGGWPLVLAALTALGIAFDASRRTARGLLDGARASRLRPAPELPR